MAQIKKLFIGSVFALSCFQGSAYAQPQKSVRALADGPPSAQSILTEATFVPFEVERLAHATVWYVDYQWHREHGINVPPEGIRSPEFAKQILDAYAWQSRTADDVPENFTGEKKTSYADYYGGFGINANFGSGRAAANGEVQTKGLKTPLAKSKDPYHSNGAVQTIEAVDEAIWSQILDSEMKYGSNKVVAVILTGTYAKAKNGQVFPRALIVREMAVRPAHFMQNTARNQEEDQARLDRVNPNLLKALPLPEGFQSQDPKQIVKTGVLELVRREATAQAEYYAKRMYFGSVSPSNLEITGRRLDLGDHTAQEGFTRIFRLPFDSPFGETKGIAVMMDDIRKAFRKALPKELVSSMPTVAQIQDTFNQTFESQRSLEMVRLAGFPNELIENLKGSLKLQKLAQEILKTAEAGNTEKVFMEHAGYKNTSKYDLGSILQSLANVTDVSSVAQLENVLSEQMKDDATARRDLAEAYLNFWKEMEPVAFSQGLSRQSLRTYVREAAAVRNRTKTSLIRGDRRWRELWDTTDKALNEKNPAVIENYIEAQRSQNQATFKDAGPFQVVLRESKRAAEGLSLRQAYDARRGSYVNILRIDVSNGAGYLNGQRLSIADFLKATFDVTGEGQGTVRGVKAQRAGNQIELVLPTTVGSDLNQLRISKSLRTSGVQSANQPKISGLRCEKIYLK